MKILSLAKANLTIVLSALSIHFAGEAAEEPLHQTLPQPGLLKSEFMFLQAPFPASHASTLVETKIGLLVGLAFIIVIGILLSDHLTQTNEPQQAQLAQVAGNVRTGVAVPGGPHHRCGRRQPVRRAQSIARRRDSSLGRVDADAKRRTAIRGAQDPAVPGPG